MFAVSGMWKMDPSMRAQQEQMLPQLVEGVKKNPGFVRGFWANDLDEPDQSVTFIVFETLDQARGFRDAVLANAPAQADSGVERGGLRIVEVRAEG
jgi:quinol monooxygenase YgiN